MFDRVEIIAAAEECADDWAKPTLHERFPPTGCWVVANCSAIEGLNGSMGFAIPAKLLPHPCSQSLDLDNPLPFLCEMYRSQLHE
jgi:hypothetical protein